MDLVPLEQDQEELLAIMVEASRAIPREQRQPFLLIQAMDGNHLLHPGVAATGRAQYQPHLGDLETLHERGLIRLTVVSAHHTYTADLRPEGTHYYEQMQTRRGQSIAKAVTTAREYLETESFRRRHEGAVAKWEAAEHVLWSAASQQAATTIGHLCREAMQLFASELVQAEVVSADATVQNTVSRVRSVLGALIPAGGRRALSDALIVYWGTVVDLTQRQEHGAQREQAPLIWEDSRRVVTQTLMVMYELDRELQHGAR
jgi:hypothetical protein